MRRRQNDHAADYDLSLNIECATKHHCVYVALNIYTGLYVISIGRMAIKLELNIIFIVKLVPQSHCVHYRIVYEFNLVGKVTSIIPSVPAECTGVNIRECACQFSEVFCGHSREFIEWCRHCQLMIHSPQSHRGQDRGIPVLLLLLLPPECMTAACRRHVHCIAVHA